MILDPLPHRNHRPILHPEVVPSLDNPDFFCQACELQLPSKKNYYIHLREKRNISYKQRLKNKINQDPNSYCSVCDMAFGFSYYRSTSDECIK
jgi:hypothetical protein